MCIALVFFRFSRMPRRHYAILFLSALLFQLAGSVVAADKADKKAEHPLLPATAKLQPAKGMFLVARRNLPDPRFRNTVVLLLQHDERGTLGLIINRRSHLSLSHMLPELKEKKQKLFYGGPVSPYLMFFLTKSTKAVANSERIFDQIYAGGHRKTLMDLLSKNMGTDTLRIYSGHAGWARGQLKLELARGDWHLMPADAGAVFKREPKTLWQELIQTADPAGIIAAKPPTYTDDTALPPRSPSGSPRGNADGIPPLPWGNGDESDSLWEG